MSILQFPTEIIPNSMNIILSSNSRSFESTFNYSVNTHSFPGRQWTATLNFDTLDNYGVREIDILQAFIWSLDGVNGRFMCPIFGRRGRPAYGNPVVSGSGQTGGTLVTSGWLPNRLVLPKAHYFQVGDELKQVKEDVVSNAAGEAALTFNPWLRSSPTDGDEIITDSPQGMFRLSSNDQGNFSISEGYQGSVSIDIVEAFYV